MQPNEAKMQHTPGPWSANSDPVYDYGEPRYIWGPKGPGYGIVCELPMNAHVAVNAADAHLIAAAPDLLAACEEAAMLLGLIGGTAEADRVVRRVEAAISKAKGGAA